MLRNSQLSIYAVKEQNEDYREFLIKVLIFIKNLVVCSILNNFYSKSIIINSGDSLVLLIELVCDFFGDEVPPADFFVL